MLTELAGLDPPPFKEGDEDTLMMKESFEGEVEDMDNSIKEASISSEETMFDNLSLVQEMVREVKGGLLSAMEELAKIQGDDQKLRQDLADSKAESCQKVADLFNVIEELRVEVHTISNMIREFKENQKMMQDNLSFLHKQSVGLLNELQADGTISDQTRQRLQLKADSCKSSATSDWLFPRCTRLLEDSQSSSVLKTEMHGLLVSQWEYDSSVVLLAKQSLNLSQALGLKHNDVGWLHSSDEETLNESEDYSQHANDSSPLGNKGLCDSRLPPLHIRTVNEGQRLRLAYELLESERSYCNVLWMLIDGYMVPMKQSELLLNRELKTLFPQTLVDLYHFHCCSLNRMQHCLASWDGLMGNLFLQFADQNDNGILAQYRHYAYEVSASLICLNKHYVQSKKLRYFLSAKHCGSSNPLQEVSSAIVAPLQRIPNYMLLIRQLLQYTDVNHPDFYFLELAINRMSTFTKMLNNVLDHSLQTGNVERKNLNQSRTSRCNNASGPCSSSSNSDEAHQTTSSARESGVFSNGENKLSDNKQSKQRLHPGLTAASWFSNETSTGLPVHPRHKKVSSLSLSFDERSFDSWKKSRVKGKNREFDDSGSPSTHQQDSTFRIRSRTRKIKQRSVSPSVDLEDHQYSDKCSLTATSSIHHQNRNPQKFIQTTTVLPEEKSLEINCNQKPLESGRNLLPPPYSVCHLKTDSYGIYGDGDDSADEILLKPLTDQEQSMPGHKVAASNETAEVQDTKTIQHQFCGKISCPKQLPEKMGSSQSSQHLDSMAVYESSQHEASNTSLPEMSSAVTSGSSQRLAVDQSVRSGGLLKAVDLNCQPTPLKEASKQRRKKGKQNQLNMSQSDENVSRWRRRSFSLKASLRSMFNKKRGSSRIADLALSTSDLSSTSSFADHSIFHFDDH